MRTHQEPSRPPLSARLRCVVEAVDQAERVFDVGCDHALVAIALILQARCHQVYAMDRRAGPLATAAARIAHYRVSDRVMPVLADGLGAHRPARQDVVVIAGLGGHETIRILQRAAPFESGVVCVLQPMKSAFALRTYLADAGFHFEQEWVCREKRHLYCVMRVRYLGEPRQKLTLDAAYAGPCILAAWDAGARPASLHMYLHSILARCRKATRSDATLVPVVERLAARIREAAREAETKEEESPCACTNCLRP